MTDANDDRLTAAARQLNPAISPQRDLWPGIADAIARPARRRWTPMLAQAAAIVLLVGASSGVTYLAVKDQPQSVTQVTPELLFEQASFGGRYTLGPGFQDARNAIIAEFDVELERLSPQARAEIEKNLEIVHKAIYDINQALEQEPGNELLQERLASTYREELMLLQRVGGLTRNVMLRNDI